MPTLAYTFMLILFVCQFCSSSRVSTVSKTSSSNTTESMIIRKVYQDVNTYRTSHQKDALKIETDLNRIAYRHSLNMAKGKVPFSHDGFEGRVEAVGELTEEPYTIAENLYSTKRTSGIAEVALKSWIESSGHNRNMLGDWLYTGIGVARSSDGEYFITQIFMGKKEE